MLSGAQVRVIDPILTTVAQGYANQDLIYDALFPRVPVEISGGQILQFGKEAFMQYNLKRAPGAKTKRIDIGYLGKPFALLQDAIEGKVPREFQRDAAIMPGIDLGRVAVTTTMKVILLSLERDAAALALATGTYAGDHQVALAGAAKWSNAASDPVAAIKGYKEVIRASTGVYPTTLACSAVAFTAFTENPAVRDRLKYTSGDPISEQIAARLLGLQKVVVGKAVQSDDAGAMTDVWGNNAVLAFTELGTPDAAVPSYGYTYTMNGHPLAEPPYWDASEKSWIYPTTMERVPVVPAASAGFLIQTPN